VAVPQAGHCNADPGTGVLHAGQSIKRPGSRIIEKEVCAL
jgi:hypothetical protein